MSISSPLEHPIQAFLEMRLILILSNFLSLMGNYRHFFIILMIEADISVAEPFVIILRLRFATLMLAILVDII